MAKGRCLVALPFGLTVCLCRLAYHSCLVLPFALPALQTSDGRGLHCMCLLQFTALLCSSFLISSFLRDIS